MSHDGELSWKEKPALSTTGSHAPSLSSMVPTSLHILRLFIPAADFCKGPQDGDVPTGMGRECHLPFPTSRNHKFMCCDYCLLACLLVSFEYLTMNGSTIPVITFPFNKKTFRAFPLKKSFFFLQHWSILKVGFHYTVASCIPEGLCK